MRKHTKLVATMATLLIAAAGVITFEACNKKNEVVNNIPELNTPELSDMDKEMILFGKKMKSATKGGETMPLEEAIRNLSNYENFKMCDASNYSANMERFTIEAEIPVMEGNVYLSDINALYESNRKQIKDKLASIEGDNKTVYSIFSRIEESSKDGDDATIVTRVNIYGPQPIGFGIDIDSTDYWHPFNDEGKCGPYWGQNIGMDATDRLQQIANTQILLQDCGAGYRMFFYNDDIEYIYASDWADTNSPNGHYGLIHNDYEASCLTPDDMRYYRDNIIAKITEWKSQQGLAERVLTLVWYMDGYETILYAEFAKVGCTLVGFDD